MPSFQGLDTKQNNVIALHMRMVIAFLSLFLAATAIADLRGTVVRVTDGVTLQLMASEVQGRAKTIRLEGIDALEI